MTTHYSDKVKARLQYLQDKLMQLKRFQEMPLQEFNEDDCNQAAAERYVQTAIEACIDVAQLIVIEEQLEKPGDVRTHFTMISDADILPSDLAKRLNAAKDVRDTLVYEYLSIEKEYIHKVLQYDVADLETFSGIIAGYLQSNLKDD